MNKHTRAKIDEIASKMPEEMPAARHRRMMHGERMAKINKIKKDMGKPKGRMAR